MNRLNPILMDPYFLDQLEVARESLTVEEDERCALVVELLPKLGEKHRAVIMALYWGGFGVRAYGRRIGKNDRTVRRWRDQALAELRRLLEENNDG